MRILSFNVRCDVGADGPDDWSHRAPLLFRVIDRQKADLVALQEVLPHQRSEIESRFPNYRWLGRGRNYNGDGEQCTIGVLPSCRILDWSTFWLSETPQEPASVGWDACLPRICTWAYLQHEDLRFCFANVHLDHLGATARLESAKLLCRHFESLALPTVVAGDFNCEAYDEPIKAMKVFFHDSYGILYPDCRQGTFQAFGAVPEEERPRIDYIFSSRDFDISEAGILKETEPPFSSDHFPIQCYLRRASIGSSLEAR